MAHIEIKLVATITGAGVVEPLRQLAAHAGVQRVVENARLDQRQESERIDLRPVGGIERAPVVSSVRPVAQVEGSE